MSDSHDPVADDGAPPLLPAAEVPEPEPEPDLETEPDPETEPEAGGAAAADVPDNGHPDPALVFVPAGVRYRYDGWTPDKQVGFIERLADCGCVEEAARAVGMSRNSAYALRRRDDAQAFRLAWDAAQDHAIVRLSDAALSRAINGVAVPVFHQGEVVGERRHYNERLTMFLLRYRDPARYGRWLDRIEVRQHEDGPAVILGYRVGRVLRAAWTALQAAWRGDPPPPVEPEPVRTAAAD